MKVELLKSVPKIIISLLAYNKMKIYVKYTDKEVGWLGTVSREEETFIIEDVFLIEQEVNSTTCELLPESILDFYEDRQLNGLSVDNILMWGHSHVNMSTSPSGQDDNQFKDFYENNDYFIRLIMNKRDEINLSLIDKKSDLLITEITPIIESVLSEDEENEIIDELKEKVKDKVIVNQTSTPTNLTNYYSDYYKNYQKNDDLTESEVYNALTNKNYNYNYYDEDDYYITDKINGFNKGNNMKYKNKGE